MKVPSPVKVCLSLTTLVLVAWLSFPATAEGLAAPAVEGLEIATLGGGRFWDLEAHLSHLKGVGSVVAGYSGGTVPNPTVRQLLEGRTGHAEVVQVLFDPRVLSYRDLLEVFLSIHDPTQRRGDLQRSVIFFHSQGQRRIAQAATVRRGETVVTEVAPFRGFYRADDHHQDYYENHPDATYCQQVLAPRLEAFRKKFSQHLKN